MSQNQVGNGLVFPYNGMQNYFTDSKMQTALLYTLVVAIIATAVSVVVGTFTSIGIYKLTKRNTKHLF